MQLKRNWYDSSNQIIRQVFTLIDGNEITSFYHKTATAKLKEK